MIHPEFDFIRSGALSSKEFSNAVARLQRYTDIWTDLLEKGSVGITIFLSAVHDEEAARYERARGWIIYYLAHPGQIRKCLGLADPDTIVL